MLSALLRAIEYIIVGMPIKIAQDAHADEVLSNDSFALLAGMLLDQQSS